MARPPKMSYSRTAEIISLMMTFAGATISERQQDVLAMALLTLEAEVRHA